MKPTEIIKAMRKALSFDNLVEHASLNLEGALIDLERTEPRDEVVVRTVRRVIDQLSEADHVSQDYRELS